MNCQCIQRICLAVLWKLTMEQTQQSSQYTIQDKIGTYSVIRFPTAMQASAYSQINFVKLSKTLLYSMTQQCTARLSFMNNTVSLLRTFSVQYIYCQPFTVQHSESLFQQTASLHQSTHFKLILEQIRAKFSQRQAAWRRNKNICDDASIANKMAQRCCRVCEKICALLHIDILRNVKPCLIPFNVSRHNCKRFSR